MDADDGERELYEDAARGDAAAFEALLERYLPQLHGYVRLRLGASVRARESSMDVVQSVCRQVLASDGSRRFDREEQFRAWLFTAALNKIRDKHRYHHAEARSPGREQDMGTSNLAEAARSLLTPSLGAVGAEAAAALQQALAALPPEQREVIELARVVGLPHRVTAELSGRSEESVRQLLSRGLRRLAHELQRRGVPLG